MEQLKQKLFELGVATPYIIADALAGAFEETIDNLELVKRARKTKETVDPDVIDAEFTVEERRGQQ